MRPKLFAKMAEGGIDTRGFFTPLSEMDIYRQYANRTCEVSHHISKCGINFPTSYEISQEVIDRIHDDLNAVVND